MEVIPVETYNIFLGDVEESLREFLAQRSYSRLIVLVDEHTKEYCLPRITAALTGREWSRIVIPSGEQNKDLETCRIIWERMMAVRTDRKSLVIDLGGGVIGDMGGFCASTFKRGVDFVQIPTTLLAQVDASIGGKLGIDFSQVKNSIGLFRNPEAVFVDPGFLSTLPGKEIRSGFAEIVKHSLIADRHQWEQLRQIDDLDRVEWKQLIGPSLEIKRRIVLEDPYEQGLRKALNFGHTVGHAVESFALGTTRPLLHGEAVAIGMVCEAYLSHHQLGLAEAQLQQISEFILRIYDHYPLDIDQMDTLLGLMANDKKNEGGEINFSLLPAAGSVKVNQAAEPSAIEESLLYYNGLLVRN